VTSTRAFNFSTSVIFTLGAFKNLNFETFSFSLSLLLLEFFLVLIGLLLFPGVLLLDFLGIDFLARLVLDFTSTSFASSLFTFGRFFEHSKSINELFSIHSLDGILVLHLREVFFGFGISCSIRELDDLKELSSDEASSSTTSLKLKKDIEIFCSRFDSESLFPPFNTVLEFVLSDSKSLELVV